MNPQLRRVLEQLPLVGPPLRELRDLRRYRTWVPPGHYYSPIPNPASVRPAAAVSLEIPGVDLRADAQLQLMELIGTMRRDVPWGRDPRPEVRFYYDNLQFGPTDAIFLYGLLRHLRPRRLVEVGVGFSSAVVLDTNAQALDGTLDCIFIDPDPTRLRALARPGDRFDLHTVEVQDLPLALFEELQARDVLFIDSSHVSKTGSDVNFLMFDVLPRLAAGVYVHFHDVAYPFDYPDDWVREGRAWNEAYLVRAFLTYNHAFEIVVWPTYLFHCHRGRLMASIPDCVQDPGGSLWIRRRVQA
jgi:predicted O-methyltransferase YrrM